MILGIGLDITELSRITRSWERFGMRFAEKILHAEERIRFQELSASKTTFLASRFAAKEAAVKALGTGFTNGITPMDIAVLTAPSGKPLLAFHGKAEEALRQLGATRVHISITHGKETVAAVVVLEGGST